MFSKSTTEDKLTELRFHTGFVFLKPKNKIYFLKWNQCIYLFVQDFYFVALYCLKSEEGTSLFYNILPTH